jgi:hypothetical protein
MTTFITHEELRTAVVNALFGEYSHGEKFEGRIDDLPMPDDAALMEAATITDLAAYVTAEEAGGGETALLKYADEVAVILFF